MSVILIYVFSQDELFSFNIVVCYDFDLEYPANLTSLPFERSLARNMSFRGNVPEPTQTRLQSTKRQSPRGRCNVRNNAKTMRNVDVH